MSTSEPNVRLKLRSRPENVTLVRAVLAGVAEAIELADEQLDDVRTAVTEACNNVVLHAYGGREGPLEVDIGVGDGLLRVAVRDAGVGIRGRSDSPDGERSLQDGSMQLGELSDESLRLGLPVIQALAAEVELRRPPGGGTEVRMEFSTPGSRPLQDARSAESSAPAIELLPMGGAGAEEISAEEPSSERLEPIAAVTISITPDRLARTVLPRLVGALAARASFSIDRLSDAQLVADVIAAQAFESIVGSHLGVGITVAPRSVELLVGPLPLGPASEAAADSVLGKLGQVVGKLIDEHSIAAVGSAAVLALQLIDRR
jgi:anti-sigma regulatory factor (Ser/Thr protein kinase)